MTDNREDRDDILAARAADAMARLASVAKGKDMNEWEDESGSRVSQTTARAAFDAAKEAATANVRVLAREILQWHATGLLQDGELRKIGEMVRPFAGHDHLGVAEKLATDAALEVVANAE